MIMVDKGYTARNHPEKCSNFSLVDIYMHFTELCLAYLNGEQIVPPENFDSEFVVFCGRRKARLSFYYGSAVGKDVSGFVEYARRQIKWRDRYDPDNFSELNTLDAMEFMCHKCIPRDDSQKYIKKVNNILSSYGNKFKMNEEGNIENVLTEDKEELITETLARAPETDREKIERAIFCVKNRKATLEDKKDAIRNLNLAIESERKEFEKRFPKEANLVFRYVNEYGIRHNNQKQKEMKDEAELDFLIHLQFAIIDFLQKTNAEL